MNACIRAVVRAAATHELEVLGVRRGYCGLVHDDLIPLGPRDVGNIIQRGGTVLGSSRCAEFKTDEGQAAAAATLRARAIDGLVVCGGDGTFRGALALGGRWPGAVVGVPASIDNDIHGTDTTIGFDTAVNTALEAIDRIRDTAEAQGRIFLVEVMGRGSGAIALEVALAGGAVAALVPEARNDLSSLLDFLRGPAAQSRQSSIIVVAEGDEGGGAFAVARALEPEVDAPLRVAVLGHIQRGGAPTAASRVLATRFGVAAVEALVEGAGNVMVGVQGGTIVHTPLAEARTRTDEHLAETAALVLRLAR
jgi:6-phosphofructokinase 1